MPLPLLIGAGLAAGALAPAIAGGISNMFGAGKELKQRNEAMLKQANRGIRQGGGYTEAQKRQMGQGAKLAVEGQTAGARAELGRQAAAGGGFGASGAQQEALNKVAQAEASGAAQARGQIDAASQQQAEANRQMWLQQRDQAMGQLANRAAQNQQLWMAGAQGLATAATPLLQAGMVKALDLGPALAAVNGTNYYGMSKPVAPPITSPGP